MCIRDRYITVKSIFFTKIVIFYCNYFRYYFAISSRPDYSDSGASLIYNIAYNKEVSSSSGVVVHITSHCIRVRIAVSYTHLDVYKRQGVYRLLLCVCQLFILYVCGLCKGNIIQPYHYNL